MVFASEKRATLAVENCRVFSVLTYESCHCEIVIDLFHCSEFFKVKHLLFTVQ